MTIAKRIESIVKERNARINNNIGSFKAWLENQGFESECKQPVSEGSSPAVYYIPETNDWFRFKVEIMPDSVWIVGIQGSSSLSLERTLLFEQYKSETLRGLEMSIAAYRKQNKMD